MWIAILAGIIVSIDALFIGISFGTQKRCRFWHVFVINIVLFALCLIGYFFAVYIGDSLDFEIDMIIGLLFIALGLWVMLSYFKFEHRKQKNAEDGNHQLKSIVLTGLFMSVEAMFITIGLTLTLDVTTILIPITVGLAHFVYSVITFSLAKHLRRFPPMAGHIMSGVALIAYGVMALVL